MNVHTQLHAVWLAVSLLLSSVAHAQAADTDKADAAFNEGKQLMAAGHFAQACPLFADSFEADPATGTLLALAICHERQGKLASAWQDYRGVAERSKAEARADREKVAREKIAE